MLIMLLRDMLNWMVGTPTVGDERSHRRFYSRHALWEKRAYLWWLYPVIGLYTFGYSATTYPIPADPEHYYSENEAKVGTAIKATVAGLLWPPYWTWEVMDNADT